MLDQPQDVVPLDPGRINSMDPLEVRHWCAELHCSEGALVAAIADVGEHVAAVRERLSQTEPKS